MRVENQFTSIASDPVGRLINVHRDSLARSGNERQAHNASQASREADAGQFRIVLNAARREIDRLRRGVDQLDPHLQQLVIDYDPSDSTQPTEPAGTPPREPKVYAPPPIGQPNDVTSTSAPTVVKLPCQTPYCFVVDQSQLIDVLA